LFLVPPFVSLLYPSSFLLHCSSFLLPSSSFLVRVVKVLKRAGFEKADVMVGHSMGSPVCLETCLLFPEMVSYINLFTYINPFDGVSGMPWDMSALPRDGERRILRCTVTVVCVLCVVCFHSVLSNLCVSVCRSVCFHTSINITQVSLLLFRNTVFHNPFFTPLIMIFHLSSSPLLSM
jgi:hypothetical protein